MSKHRGNIFGRLTLKLLTVVNIRLQYKGMSLSSFFFFFPETCASCCKSIKGYEHPHKPFIIVFHSSSRTFLSFVSIFFHLIMLVP